MSAKVRVIGKLDIKGPNLVKGLQFDGYRVLGLAETFAQNLYAEGIDELFYQDVVASLYRRNSLLDIVSSTAREVFVPITVAGGLRSVDDVRAMLRAGADKVAINTAAIQDPALITRVAETFGSQCMVASIESFKRRDGSYEVWVDYGRQKTHLDVYEWASRVEELGAGEILLTSINNDGMGTGFDGDLIAAVARRVSIPVIGCGGAGRAADFNAALRAGADAVAAASVFHYRYARFDNFDQGDMRSRYELRIGQHRDAGNVDFIANGYGGGRAILVEPATVGEVKDCLAGDGVRVRGVEV